MPVAGGRRFVGREVELAVLRAAVSDALDGGLSLVAIEGEAGIGKTRLVAELVAGLGDALVITGHGVDMSTGEIPFGIVADSLRHLVRTAGADVLLPLEREALAPLLPGSGTVQRGERVEVMSTFVDLLERLAADRLVVWVVEDLHWADAATRDLVNLVARTAVGRLVMIVTVRTDDPDRGPETDAAVTALLTGLGRLPGARTVRLGRLSPADVRRQLAELAAALPAEAIARIEHLSDGVPFVVEELAAAAGRSDPVSVSAAAAGRLASLSPEARRLVEAAAVGEGHLRVSLLEQVVDATPDELDAALAEAIHAGVLVADAAADHVGFRHALLRDAADRMTGPGARRSWHRRWAEVLESGQGALPADPAVLAIAEHWHHAREPRRAVAAAVAALPAAERIGTSADEVRLGLRILAGWDQRGDGLPISHRSVVATTLRAAINAGRVPTAAAVSQVESDDPQISAMLVFLREYISLPKGKPAEAAALALVSSVDTDAWPDDLLTAFLANLLGMSLPVGDSRADRLLERSLRITADAPGSHVHVGARGIRAVRRMRTGEFDASIALLREALDEPTMHPVDRWFNEGNLIWALTVTGRLDAADEVAGPALSRISHPQAEPYPWEHLVENVAVGWLLGGSWRRAREVLESNAPYWTSEQCYANLWLDLLDLHQGRDPDLARWRPLDGLRAGGPVTEEVRRVLATGAVRHDLAEARELVRPLWATLPDPVGSGISELTWVTLCEAARWEADHRLVDGVADPEADAHMTEITGAAAVLPRLGALGEVWPLEIVAQLDRFHGRDARQSLVAALEGWQRLGHLPDVARTHLSLAEAHAAHGERNQARDHLAAGRAIATDLDARPVLARADAVAERFALDVRERRAEGLTERETEVLRLLADGRTNAEIAATLFMSPKTASVHVSHIIAKLDVANRTEAASVAHRHGLV